MMTAEQFVQLVAALDTTDEAPLTDADIVTTLDELIVSARQIAAVDMEDVAA